MLPKYYHALKFNPVSAVQGRGAAGRIVAAWSIVWIVGEIKYKPSIPNMD